jgi:adenine phosphoribosyltransferase
MENQLEKYIKAVPDFPKPGVLFRDVTGILDSGEGFRLAMIEMERALSGVHVDKVAAPESRGFIFGAALADRLRCAFVPIRKPGKLPRETISEDYELEYGRATVHMHKDAISQGESIVLVDDLLATGGTALAGARLIERLGGKVVKMMFPIELEGFGAVKGVLSKYDVTSLVKYPGK